MACTFESVVFFAMVAFTFFQAGTLVWIVVQESKRRAFARARVAKGGW